MQSAAGCTSQRLKPAVAIVRSLSRNPAPAPDTVPALLMVVIVVSPCRPPLAGPPAVQIPLFARRGGVILALLLRTIPDAPGSISAFENYKPQTPPAMPIGFQLRRNLACPGTVLCPAQNAALPPQLTEKSNWDRSRDRSR